MGTLIYDGATGFISANPGFSGLGIPGVRQLAYGQFSIFPQSNSAGTPTLNTNLGAGNTGYAGYTNYDPLSVRSTFTLLNPAFPTLDRSTGFTLSFNVAVTAETSNPNRAGFSIIAISSDGAGIELGFKEQGANDRIFAQSADFIESEFITPNINAATTYVVTILGNNYTLSNGTQTLTGLLRNYNFNPAASSPPLPFNPYISPNFLFLGDGTDQGNATVTLGAMFVNAIPVAKPDNYSTNEDVPLTIAATSVLANDTDADKDPLTAVLETGPANGTLTLNPNGTFSYTPAANFSGTDSFTYRTNDGTANSSSVATVAIAVNAVADAPTLTVDSASGDEKTPIPLNINAALADTDGSENLSIQISNIPASATVSAGTNLGGGIWQLTPDQLTGLSIIPSTDNDFALTVSAIATETSNRDTASKSATLDVIVNAVTPTPIPTPTPTPTPIPIPTPTPTPIPIPTPTPTPIPIPTPTPTPGTEPSTTPLSLTRNPDNIFLVQGSPGQTKLQFTLAPSGNSAFVNEVGVFVVDDDKGTINGIVPNSTGYLESALRRSQVIFSALSIPPNGFGAANPTRVLSVDPSDRLVFYLVQNNTTDMGLADLAAGRKSPNVFFASPSLNADGFDHLRVSDQGSGVFTLGWEEELGGGNQDFNDLVLNVQAIAEPLTLGAGLQGEGQQELIDLRDKGGLVPAELVLNREAAFDNFAGLYKVVDAKGGIDLDGNGTVDFRPGDPGYAKAAIQQRLTSLDLIVANQGTAKITGQLEGGSIYAPFLIANGRPEALLEGNQNNDPAVYFPFLGANADGVDHVRLLGDNTFGFEDLPGGGDGDFNDLVLQVKFT